MDDRGDYNSSPCTSYRRAKNVTSDVHPAEPQIRYSTSWHFFQSKSIDIFLISLKTYVVGTH